QSRERVQHPQQCLFESLRNLNGVGASEKKRVKKEVDRIDVVIGRLFEMEAIGLNLTVCLGLHDLPSQVTPQFRFRGFTQGPNEEKGDSLAHQMRIRGEV